MAQFWVQGAQNQKDRGMGQVLTTCSHSRRIGTSPVRSLRLWPWVPHDAGTKSDTAYGISSFEILAPLQQDIVDRYLDDSRKHRKEHLSLSASTDEDRQISPKVPVGNAQVCKDTGSGGGNDAELLCLPNLEP